MKHYLEMPETSRMTQRMNPDDRTEALEEAGLDPDDYDFD